MNNSVEKAFAANFTDLETSSQISPIDELNTVDSIGTVANLQKYYAPIQTYEGKHRCGPKARWTSQEEKMLVRLLN